MINGRLFNVLSVKVSSSYDYFSFQRVLIMVKMITRVRDFVQTRDDQRYDLRCVDFP